jgi:hypothetical protein
MEIKFDVTDSQVIYDVIDGVFVALLKSQLKESEEFLAIASNEIDRKDTKKMIKSCKVILKHYGVHCKD